MGDSEASPLADGVIRDSLVSAQYVSVHVYDGTGAQTVRRDPAKQGAIIGFANEADLLTFRFVGYSQAEAGGYFPNLRFCQISQWKQRVRQLALGETTEEI